MQDQQYSERFTRRSFAKRALGATAATFFSAASIRDVATFAADVSPSSALAAAPASANAAVAASPYGVCAHLGGGEEFAQIPKNLDMMREIGVSWVRADFSWSGIENPQGEWSFERLDRAVDETNRRGIQILPILDYDVPWATPAFEHLDAWTEYVRRVVARYRDKIRYWEVWNEPNLQDFWRARPNGADYATLLKATYRTIKEIDPNLVVLYGGLAGVPVDFFEASLDAGAGEFFDVVNIHPYRGGLTSRGAIDRFFKEIDAFKNALAARSIAPKPIWITEMGWATPPIFGETNARVVDAGLQKVFPNAAESENSAQNPAVLPKVALFFDERYAPAASTTRDDFANILPKRYRTAAGRERFAFVDADELANLTAADFDALILPPSETFPADRFDVFVRFVRDGGALFLLGGVPFYYSSTRDENGDYVQDESNPDAARHWDALRLSWFAWWTRENVPQEVPVAVAPDAARELAGYYPVVKGTRFFDSARLWPDDSAIPLLLGKNENFEAPVACVYRFADEYRGAIVVSSLFDSGAGTNVSTVENQAIFLPQAYLTALANGVERYFWYEFHAPQRDPVDKESHFGIAGGPNLEPKPAYFAFQAMTRARPAASQGANLTRTDDVCVVSWTRPDGKKGWAVWAPRAEKTATLEIVGTVDAAFDGLGADVERPASGTNRREISRKILYLIGPDRVEIAD